MGKPVVDGWVLHLFQDSPLSKQLSRHRLQLVRVHVPRIHLHHLAVLDKHIHGNSPENLPAPDHVACLIGRRLVELGYGLVWQPGHEQFAHWRGEARLLDDKEHTVRCLGVPHPNPVSKLALGPAAPGRHQNHDPGKVWGQLCLQCLASGILEEEVNRAYPFNHFRALRLVGLVLPFR